jgi:hypothetical protein
MRQDQPRNPARGRGDQHVLLLWSAPLCSTLARIIHEGSSRKRADAKRDGHSEAGDWLCRLRRCLSRFSQMGTGTKKKGTSP